MRAPLRAWSRVAQTVVLSLSIVSPWGALARAEFIKRVPLATAPSFVGYVPDQLVVVFTPDARRRLVVDARSGRPVVNLPSVQGALDAVGALELTREFAQAAGSRFPDLTGHYEVRIPLGADLDAAIATLERDPNVDHVEKIGIHTLDATPNDTYYRYGTSTFPYDQWHYWDSNGIDADLAWNIETGSPNVVVAILDSGVKYAHSDLGTLANPPSPTNPSTDGNIWVNAGEIPGNGIDDDGDGYVDDVIGWDFVTAAGGGGVTCLDVDCAGADNDPNDGTGHGTHVAGTVAAITNNARAVAGCNLMCLRIGYYAKYQGVNTGIVQMDWAAQAMNYVADQKAAGVNVAAINCSWGSSNSGGISAAATNLLAHDVMIVNSAGNSNSTVPPYLPTVPGVMSVAATDSFGAKASFSNHGSWVTISAPGVDVMSTYHDPTDPDPTHMYVGVLSGTSMSSPHCCGVAALLESYNPSLTRTDKFNLMVSTAVVPPGFPSDMGAGIVNAYQALLAAPAPVAVGDAAPQAARLALRARPNPSRGRTDFAVDGPAGATALVDIVDMGGRRVRQLALAVGGNARWDGTDAAGRRVPIGLYLAIARCGRASVTTKLAVLP
ncbi:MAG: hypothetical protein E6K78_12875 [Candidatus Eisenbacteria bacterium]|uniref:Peptidase S8/S53 domain-containing protein n=1 Tax=Eiseniibacteriota bacterium TaxID=2212470 RepID=A0A538TCJ7_UNCEI|nr:MAG: hypothetical protein E6K78_12875 [Candidatus Eisenbacteria bacterium]